MWLCFYPRDKLELNGHGIGKGRSPTLPIDNFPRYCLRFKMNAMPLGEKMGLWDTGFMMDDDAKFDKADNGD